MNIPDLQHITFLFLCALSVLVFIAEANPTPTGLTFAGIKTITAIICHGIVHVVLLEARNQLLDEEPIP